MAEIKWFGHACFRVRSREATILMDPIPRTLGFKVEKQRVDIVTMSHDHPGHSNIDMASGDPKLINGPGEYEMNEIFITGIRTHHDSSRGSERGHNTAYLLELEDITVCHLGDLGHALTEDQVEGLGSVDVLLVPVGGRTVIDATKAVEVVAQLDPRIIVPMQYRTPVGDYDRDELERFLKEMGIGEVAPREKLTVRQSDLGDTTEVVVLSL
jgi:L-ascorbate metabolism protein UlaG (beta-lactamase superfamily)